MAEILETPDISEDESVLTSMDDSSVIIEGSFAESNESSSESFVGTVKKKKGFVIESDSSYDEDEIADSDVKSLTKTHPEGILRSSTGVVPDNAKEHCEVKLPAMEQSYRDALPLLPSRSPTPDLADDVINISTDDEADVATVQNITETMEVTNTEYQQQIEKVQALQSNVQKTKNLMRSINVNALPDKGDALIKKYESLLEEAKNEQQKLDNMVVKEPTTQPLQPIAWENLQAGLGRVQPRTFGKQALETLNIQKALTLDRLEQLHGSLKTCPDSNTYATDPKGLRVELMPHQKHAIAWLMWRENQKPSGGILADDMGLGKTLTMISLTLKVSQAAEDVQEENDETNTHRTGSKYPGGTLVICPASLLYQWEAEIKKHVKKGLMNVGLYHGASRETKAKRLAKQDIVITTYALAMGDYNKSGPLFGIKWRRIILDEAHQVRNHKSQTSIAVCSLSAVSRWALTGTPVHNKELDLYALLKFLRCSPFDDLAVWKRWVANKTTGGQDRLHTVMSSLILRRTKQQLAENKLLNCMPEKEWKLIEITLEQQEMDVYQKVLIFSRTLFAQFLHQRAEKDSDSLSQRAINDPNGEYYKMHQRLVKLNRVKKIKQHEILVLLLRLRQICCHPSLIINMLQGDEDLGDSDLEGQEELNLLEQLNKLDLKDDDGDEYQPTNVPAGLSTESEARVGLAEASRNLLNPSNPIFAESNRSSKVKAIMKILQEIPREDKIIVVSQWTKLLDLIALQLKKEGLRYCQLDGSVPVHRRMEIVESINDSSHKNRILLLSLTAGGVGLNLVGANHLILTDLHWNPQLEIQAQDRIYRVGQNKAVKIYKLMAVDTIEQRIKQLQDRKLNLAEELLTGAKIQHHNKLSLEDLKMLFNM